MTVPYTAGRNTKSPSPNIGFYTMYSIRVLLLYPFHLHTRALSFTALQQNKSVYHGCTYIIHIYIYTYVMYPTLGGYNFSPLSSLLHSSGAHPSRSYCVSSCFFFHFPLFFPFFLRSLKSPYKSQLHATAVYCRYT